jgi:hypothetical protein
VSATVPGYRWSTSEFLRAWEAGAFDHRVELVDGEVWPVVIGDWHGRTVTRLIRILPEDGAVITSSTLPSGGSLPDPDCWVQRAGAEPVDQLSSRLSRWDPADVLLVVEVSDETVMADLTVKARLYGAAGYPAYWVVTEQVVYEHTGPTAEGYRLRQEYRAGDRLPVGYAGAWLSVDQLLGPTA